MRGSFADVAVGAAACLAILVTVGACIYAFDPMAPAPRLVLTLAGVVGSTLGWATGIVLSPYDEKTEQRAFKGVGKAVYGAAIGYAAAKLDPLVNVLVEGARTRSVDPVVGVGLAIALSCFVAVATLTYVSRKYWH